MRSSGEPTHCTLEDHRPGRRTCATALLALTFGIACASPPTQTIEWYKRGADDVELARTLEACKAISGSSVDEAPTQDGGAKRPSGALASCMRQRGWVWGVASD